ncbi:hypothetical protein [Streptomyces sp. NPDC059979]|uniref:hypothetical protein n=1 Tax=Streptomyces sp. NPDC059979 TaxID=3347021 RepID=UPI0036967AFD
MRLLKAIDEAADAGRGLPGELSEFERIVLYGVAELPGPGVPAAGPRLPAYLNRASAVPELWNSRRTSLPGPAHAQLDQNGTLRLVEAVVPAHRQARRACQGRGLRAVTGGCTGSGG